MREFLYKSKTTLVFAARILLEVLLLLVFLLMLSKYNPWLLRISRTAAVTGLTYISMKLLLSRIYGIYDIGVRKSRPIVLSLTVCSVITDILAFVMLVIMNINETTGNKLYPYFGWDVLRLIIIMIIQYLLILAFTYGGNALYFAVTPPERCVIIADDSEQARAVANDIAKYAKQYQLCKLLKWTSPELYEKIESADTIFSAGGTPEQLSDMMYYCFKMRKNYYRSMGVTNLLSMTSTPFQIDDRSYVKSGTKQITMGQRIAKRLFDIIVSAIGLIITSPIMLITALCIWIEDGGEVIFKQNRVTINQRIFTMYKFRSMKKSADDSMVVDDDDRITKVGRVIRKFRIDELPQLVNVIKGDMSIVGPRAEMASRVYLNTEDLPDYVYRYRMKGGITGYAQIYGKYNTSAYDKLMMDLTYMQTFSLWSDFKIFCQTISVLLTPERSTASYSESDEEKLEQQIEQVQEEKKIQEKKDE